MFSFESCQIVFLNLLSLVGTRGIRIHRITHKCDWTWVFGLDLNPPSFLEHANGIVFSYYHFLWARNWIHLDNLVKNFSGSCSWESSDDFHGFVHAIEWSIHLLLVIHILQFSCHILVRSNFFKFLQFSPYSYLVLSIVIRGTDAVISGSCSVDRELGCLSCWPIQEETRSPTCLRTLECSEWTANAL